MQSTWCRSCGTTEADRFDRPTRHLCDRCRAESRQVRRVYYKAWHRARQRAFGQLAKEHPERYSHLLAVLTQECMVELAEELPAPERDRVMELHEQGVYGTVPPTMTTDTGSWMDLVHIEGGTDGVERLARDEADRLPDPPAATGAA